MGRRAGFRDMAWMWGEDPSLAHRQWVELNKLLGSWCSSEERRGAQSEPRGTRALLVDEAESCQVPACHPGEGKHGQNNVSEPVRNAHGACLNPCCRVCDGRQLNRRSQCKR